MTLRFATSYTADYEAGPAFLKSARRFHPDWELFTIGWRAADDGHFVPAGLSWGGIIQQGAFLDFWPELQPDDVVVFTDCDAVLQRAFNADELKLMKVERGTFGLSLNQPSEDASLMLEATFMVGNPPLDRLDAHFPGWREMVVRNGGLICGRVGDWRELYAACRKHQEKAVELLPHRSTVQWLLCYLIQRHFKLRTLPRTIHANGHFGAAGAQRGSDGLWRLNSTTIAFAHHFAALEQVGSSAF